MRLNMFRRALVLATLLGACACAALLTCALGTSRWLHAGARRSSNPAESRGEVSLGLFEGEMRLNPGYGWRHHHISVRAGTHPARQWAWLGTAVLLAAALVSAGAAALLAALNTAARPHSRARAVSGLFISNGLVVLLSSAAMGVWLTEFYLRLTHNVLSAEELANMWSSAGQADLGLSFWLVVTATVCGVGNVACVGVALLERQPDEPAPALEEKHNAAIMLY